MFPVSEEFPLFEQTVILECEGSNDFRVNDVNILAQVSMTLTTSYHRQFPEHSKIFNLPVKVTRRQKFGQGEAQ